MNRIYYLFIEEELIMKKFIAEVKTELSKISIIIKNFEDNPAIVVQKLEDKRSPFKCSSYYISWWNKKDIQWHIKLIVDIAAFMVELNGEDMQDALNVIDKVMPLYYKYLKCKSLVKFVPENIPEFLKPATYLFSDLYICRCNVWYHTEEYQADPENYWTWDEISKENDEYQEYEEDIKNILGNELFNEFEEFIKKVGEPAIYNKKEFEIYFMYYLSGLWGEVK
jgi:hypothetical protein